MEDEGTMVMLLTPGNLEVKVKTAQWGQILLENVFLSQHFDKVLSLLEACFDLISSPSLFMKIQINGRKINENLGFKSPLWTVNKFSVHFQILHKKLHIFVFNHLFDLSERGFEPQIFSNFPICGNSSLSNPKWMIF